MKQLGADRNSQLIKREQPSGVASSLRVELNSCAMKNHPLRGPAESTVRVRPRAVGLSGTHSLTF